MQCSKFRQNSGLPRDLEQFAPKVVRRGCTGLSRGEYLINEYTMLKRAATLHLVENDQECAYQVVDRFRSLSPRIDP